MSNEKLTIDPGLNGTGWALWDKDWTLLANGVITSKEKSWEVKAIDIFDQLYSTLAPMGQPPYEVFIEMPELHQSAGGMTVARSGSLVKLAWFVGFLTACSIAHLGAEQVNHITPTTWKGQLPKDVCIKRINKLMPNLRAKSHDYDAIGIGLYVQGKFT